MQARDSQKEARRKGDWSFLSLIHNICVQHLHQHLASTHGGNTLGITHATCRKMLKKGLQLLATCFPTPFLGGLGKKNKELLRSFSSNQAKRSHGIGDGLDNMDGHVSWLQNTSNSRNQGERKFIGRFRERRGKFELFSKRKKKKKICYGFVFLNFS